MSSLMWFLTRSSGIVALALMLAAVADGLLFSGRKTGRRRRPAWWLDLHRGLGGYAMAFTGLHLVTAFLAKDLGVGLAEIFVPGAAESTTAAFTWGVISLYCLAATVFTTWPRRRLKRRAWHLVHVLSVPGTFAAAVHAYQLGSDTRTTAYTTLFVLAVGASMYPLVLRLGGLHRRGMDRVEAGRRRDAAPVAAGGAPTPDKREPVGAGR